MAQQGYTYGDPLTARPWTAADGSRAISFFIFNTDVHVHAYASAEVADPALLALRDRCVFFEHALSRTRSDSDIARAHAASPEPVAIAPETAELVRLALGYCERSQGLFDITMGTVTSLWNFHTGVVPSKLALSRALPHVGYRNIALGSVSAGAPTLAITDSETVLDLGGVAKGYIADDLAAGLVAHGVDRFVINLGGNVLVRGGRPADETSLPPVRAGDPWRIGIQNPLDEAHSRAIVEVRDGSVVTSGVAERRFTRGGVTYHHILDPKTGMPAQTDVASATIVAACSLDCDGWSTTALMLGAERAIDFIEGVSGVEAVIITDRDEVLWTEGMAERLSLVPTLPRL